MAAIHVYVPAQGAVANNTGVETDDLCPSCFNPSLRLYELWRIDMTGITTVATRVRCRDEQAWMSEPKETA